MSNRQWGNTVLCGLLSAILRLCAQTLEKLGRTYRENPSPVRRSELLRYASAHKDTSGALALLTLGITESEQGQYETAQQHLTTADKRLPQITGYTAYFLALAQLEQGHNAQVEHALKSLWSESPVS